MVLEMEKDFSLMGNNERIEIVVPTIEHETEQI